MLRLEVAHLGVDVGIAYFLLMDTAMARNAKRFVGIAAPEGLERNWLPSASQDFFVIAPFYGPHKSFRDKSRTMPDIVGV